MVKNVSNAVPALHRNYFTGSTAKGHYGAVLALTATLLGSLFFAQNAMASSSDAGLVFTVVPGNTTPHYDLNTVDTSNLFLPILTTTTCIKSGKLSVPYKLRGYGSSGTNQLQLSADGDQHMIDYRVSMSNRGQPDLELDLVKITSPVAVPSTFSSCNPSDQYRLQVSISSQDLAKAGEHVYLDFFTLLISPE